MRKVTPRGLGRAVAVALVAMLLAAPAVLGHPPAPVDEGGRAITGKIHRWLHQANVPLVRGRVQIRRSACPGNPLFVGCVFTARPRTLYLRHDVRAPRLVLYHELGHIFDIRVLNGRERRAFKRIAGIRARGWYAGALPPAEWFADAYSACAARLRLWRQARSSSYGYSPTRRQHMRACRLIRRAAAPRGRPPEPPSNPPPVIEVAPPPPAEQRAGRQRPGLQPGRGAPHRLRAGRAVSPARAAAGLGCQACRTSRVGPTTSWTAGCASRRRLAAWSSSRRIARITDGSESDVWFAALRDTGGLALVGAEALSERWAKNGLAQVLDALTEADWQRLVR